MRSGSTIFNNPTTVQNRHVLENEGVVLGRTKIREVPTISLTDISKRLPKAIREPRPEDLLKTQQPVCPHCSYKVQSPEKLQFEENTAITTCWNCKNSFTVEQNVVIKYTTHKQ